MIILFSQDDIHKENVAEFYLRDEKTKELKPITFLPDKNNNLVQTMSIQNIERNYILIKQNGVAGSKTDAFESYRYSKAVVFGKADTAGATAIIRAVRTDREDRISYGEQIQLTALEYQDKNGKYYMQEKIIDTLGATKMSFVIENVSAGSIDLFISVI